MTDFSLYHASITAMDNYKQAEGELNTFIERDMPLGRIYISWDEQMMILKRHRTLITARDKAKREFEKADKEWKKEYVRSTRSNKNQEEKG